MYDGLKTMQSFGALPCPEGLEALKTGVGLCAVTVIEYCAAVMDACMIAASVMILYACYVFSAAVTTTVVTARTHSRVSPMMTPGTHSDSRPRRSRDVG